MQVTLSDLAIGEGVRLDDIDLIGSVYDILRTEDGVVLVEALTLLGIEEHQGRLGLLFEETTDNPSKWAFPLDAQITLRYC